LTTGGVPIQSEAVTRAIGWAKHFCGKRALGLVPLALLALYAPAAAQRVTLSAGPAGAPVKQELGRVADELWGSLSWRAVRPGLAWTELDLAAGPLRIPVRAVAVRVDPAAFELRLELATEANGMTGAWTIDAAPTEAALALNAGQFKETGPWGWVVLAGEERRDPGYGPLSVGVVVTDSGRVRWIPADELRAARDDRTIAYAFQTYPVILFDGLVPRLARDAALVDQSHRDARLILAERPDGALLIVLTRFDGLGGAAERVPIGLTVPESAVLMSALGARHAAMLDGGISAQLMLRDAAGRAAVWKGLRRVPLALLAMPRND
jgi:hypothetical protein